MPIVDYIEYVSKENACNRQARFVGAILNQCHLVSRQQDDTRIPQVLWLSNKLAKYGKRHVYAPIGTLALAAPFPAASCTKQAAFASQFEACQFEPTNLGKSAYLKMLTRWKKSCGKKPLRPASNLCTMHKEEGLP